MTPGTAAATIERADSVLLLIDFQERLMPAIAEGAAAAAKAIFLAATATRLGVPIVVTEQNPHGLGPTLAGLAPHAAKPFAKRHFSAAREPNFLVRMPAARRTVVVGGSEAHVCVLQTVATFTA